MQLREAGLGDSRLASDRNSLPNLAEKVHRRLSAEPLACDALLLTADCVEHCEHDHLRTHSKARCRELTNPTYPHNR
jgi:hypothetical protein